MSKTVEENDIEPYVRKRNKETELENADLRVCINSRERKRMHDLNDAMEDLRSVLPYMDPANRRMSKISTVILATNWIRHLTKANTSMQHEMDGLRRRVEELEGAHRVVGH